MKGKYVLTILTIIEAINVAVQIYVGNVLTASFGAFVLGLLLAMTINLYNKDC